MDYFERGCLIACDEWISPANILQNDTRAMWTVLIVKADALGASLPDCIILQILSNSVPRITSV